jgi:hypothetical protein
MTLAFVAACLGWVATAWVLTSALREKDGHHALHVSGLLNRIQAPVETVAQELVKDEDFDPIVLPHDEKSYWEDIQHVEVTD